MSSPNATKPVRVYPKTHRALRRIASAKRWTHAVAMDEVVNFFEQQHRAATSEEITASQRDAKSTAPALPGDDAASTRTDAGGPQGCGNSNNQSDPTKESSH